MKQNKMNIGICTSEVGFISLNISKYIYIQDPNNRCYIFCFIKNLDYYRKEKFLEINSHFNKKNKIIFLPTYFLKIFSFLISLLNLFFKNFVFYIPYPNALGLKNYFFRNSKIIFYGDGLSFYRDNEPFWLINKKNKVNLQNDKNKIIITTFTDSKLNNSQINYIKIKYSITRNFLLNILTVYKQTIKSKLNIKNISNNKINFVVSTKFNSDNLKLSRMSALKELKLFENTIKKITKKNYLNIIKIHPQSSNKFKILLNKHLIQKKYNNTIIINNYIPSEFYILYLIDSLKINKKNINMYTASHGGITSAIIGKLDNINILYKDLISKDDFTNKKWFDKRIAQEDEIVRFLKQNINY